MQGTRAHGRDRKIAPSKSADPRITASNGMLFFGTHLAYTTGKSRTSKEANARVEGCENMSTRPQL